MSHPRIPWLAMGLLLAIGAGGCMPATPAASGTQVDQFSAPSGYAITQVTEDTRQYCRLRARRCMNDPSMRELWPSWSQRAEQCRENYQECVNRNEGFFNRR
ncbi:MAG: hypothetical protein ACK46X_13880 [Candidatus Sericytochromatia bacterium]